MDNKELNILGKFLADAGKYCSFLENVENYELREFVGLLLDVLPSLYLDMLQIMKIEEDETEMFLPQHNCLEEDYYESIRRKLEMLFGEDDTYLDTFEEDMKYSDSPIGASLSENLADIFQPLYNFVVNTRQTGGDNILQTAMECRDEFESYWSQQLCNVMRPLNQIYFNN